VCRLEWDVKPYSAQLEREREREREYVPGSRGVNLVGNWGGGDERLLSGPNFLLAKLAALKHLKQ